MTVSQFITILVLQNYQLTKKSDLAYIGLLGAKTLGIIYSVRTIYEGAFLNIVADSQIGGTYLTVLTSL